MLRLSCLALLVTPFSVLAQSAPEALKSADREQYQQMKSMKNLVVVEGDAKKTEENRALLTKQAKYMVGQLLDPRRLQLNDWANRIEEFIMSDLPIPRGNKINDMGKYLAFGHEMGNALVKELEPTVKNSKVAVRLNCVRLLSIVGELGCTKAADLALNVLADEKESDGVKLYAIKTLGNLYAVEPDADNKQLTVFSPKGRNPEEEQKRELGHRSIVALCDYVMKPRETTNLSDEEQAGIRYVRREAVRALGLVKTPRVKFNQQVLARPALVLLKVANTDGLTPKPDYKERTEAILGFCQLFPVMPTGADREFQTDYAAGQLASAIVDVVQTKLNAGTNIEIPWKATGARLEVALTNWSKNISDMNLPNNAAGKALLSQAKSDLLEQLKADNPTNRPDVNTFRTWLKANPPKSTSLFSDEKESTVKLVGG